MPLSKGVTEDRAAHKTTCVILTSSSPSGRLSFLGQLVVEAVRVAIVVCLHALLTATCTRWPPLGSSRWGLCPCSQVAADACLPYRHLASAGKNEGAGYEPAVGFLEFRR
jgi:hypothetical protein